jgi:hypothetical protein
MLNRNIHALFKPKMLEKPHKIKGKPTVDVL